MKHWVVVVSLGTAVGVAILTYNLWAYCCGRCTLRGFLVIGPFETSILGLTLVAALLLVLVKALHRRQRARCRCRCGAVLSDTWGFCPECGTPRQA